MTTPASHRVSCSALILISLFLHGFSKSVPFDDESDSTFLSNQTMSPIDPTPSIQSNDTTITPNTDNRLNKFIGFFSVSMLCCILNCWAIAVMFQAKRVRRVNYLISNLSVTCILLAVYGCIYVGDSLMVFNYFRGVYLCGILSFVRNLLVSVISLSVFFISFERIRSLKSTIRHLLITRVVIFIWTFSSITMIPTLFNRVYEDHPPQIPICKKVAPFGWDRFAIAFELMRFTVFHAALCVYMIFELYEIRSKTKYLCMFKTMPNEKFRQKVQRVRFVYIFSISFMLIWLPFGFLLCVTIIQFRVSFSFLKDFPDFTMYLWWTVYFYVMIIPVIILFTSEGLSQLSLHLNLQCGVVAASPTSNADATNNACEIVDNCTSAVDETFNKTTTPQCDVSCANPIPDPGESCETDCDELSKPENVVVNV